MVVFFVVRDSLFAVPGGDTVQATQTLSALSELGVDAYLVCASHDPPKRNPDLLHVFNLTRPGDVLPWISRYPDVPLVISPIYVEYHHASFGSLRVTVSNLLRVFGPDAIEYVKRIVRFIARSERPMSMEYLWRGHRRSVRYVLRRARLLLPNSVSEYERIVRDYRISKPYVVVPNGIDAKVFDYVETEPHPRYQDAVLCVGRIEPIKNQLRVVRALSDAPYKVFIIGKHGPGSAAYYEMCRRSAGCNVEFVEGLPQAELARAFRAARVHVLASWFETTGLVSLEAAAMGCSIVVTDRGDQAEYFSGIATFCDPSSETSIRQAVDESWNSVPLDSGTVIRTRYTWSHAARETYRAYESISSHLLPGLSNATFASSRPVPGGGTE